MVYLVSGEVCVKQHLVFFRGSDADRYDPRIDHVRYVGCIRDDLADSEDNWSCSAGIHYGDPDSVFF